MRTGGGGREGYFGVGGQGAADGGDFAGSHPQPEVGHQVVAQVPGREVHGEAQRAPGPEAFEVALDAGGRATGGDRELGQAGPAVLGQLDEESAVGGVQGQGLGTVGVFRGRHRDTVLDPVGRAERDPVGVPRAGDAGEEA